MQKNYSNRLIPITPDTRLKLKAEQKRTGKTPAALLKGKKDIPDRLSLTTVLSWFDPFGPTQMAEEQHLNYMFECWATEADKHRMADISERVSIAFDYLEQLEAEQARTGLSVKELFRKTEKIPRGLSEQIVWGWQREVVQQAYPEYLDFVLETYKSQPSYIDTASEQHVYKGKGDWPAGQASSKAFKDIRHENLEPISTNDLKELQAYRDIFGFLPGRLLKLAQDAPNELSAPLISSWLNGNVKKADPELVKWVLVRCREMKKFKV